MTGVIVSFQRHYTFEEQLERPRQPNMRSEGGGDLVRPAVAMKEIGNCPLEAVRHEPGICGVDSIGHDDRNERHNGGQGEPAHPCSWRENRPTPWHALAVVEGAAHEPRDCENDEPERYERNRGELRAERQPAREAKERRLLPPAALDPALEPIQSQERCSGGGYIQS